MNLINVLKQRIPNRSKRIVFPESCNVKILQAAKLALDSEICTPVLVGDPKEIKRVASSIGIDISEFIIESLNSDKHGLLVDHFTEKLADNEKIDKDKLSNDSLYYAAILVASNEVSAMVAGIDYTSRDVILVSRDVIGMKTGVNTFSSSFIMELPDDSLITLADCATCKNPNATQLADIAMSTAETNSLILGIESKIAFLSFSTKGSGGKDDSIDKINDAIIIISAAKPELIVDGELQLDAAVNPEVARKKSPESPIRGDANILIMPDLNSANILYKGIQQFAKAKAYGPFLQGFNKSVSDLSRGATVDDIYGNILITVIRS